MKTIKLTKKQHEVDSMMVGLILAGAKTAKKPIKTSTPAMEDEKSMCAIGAGNRARKITRKPDILSTAFERQDGRQAQQAAAPTHPTDSLHDHQQGHRELRLWYQRRIRE